MNRFFYLKKIKNNSEFIGMDNFFKEIEYDKKSKKEKNFSPFKEQMDLYRKKYREGVMNEETVTKKINEVAEKMRKIAERYGVAFELATYAKEEPGLFDKKKK